METVATCSMTNGSCHGLALSFFNNDTSPTSRSRRRWPGNPNGRLKIRNLCLFMLARSHLMLHRRLCGFQRWLCGFRRWLQGWWRRIRGWWRLPEIAQTACCRCQTHCRRWPSNPNCRSKSRNFFVYVSKISTNASAAASRLTEIIQMARCRHRKHRQRRHGDDQDRSKSRHYENVCLWDQAKPLEKHLCCLIAAITMALRTVLFLLSLATTFVLT